MKPLPDWGKPFKQTAFFAGLHFCCFRSFPAMILLLLLKGFLPLYAQPAIQWDKNFGGNQDDYLRTLQQTSDGGYILGGTSDSPTSGDKSQGGQGSEDYWVVKLDAAGNKQWDRTFGGILEDRLNALQQTSDGGYILGGTSESGISGDKTQDNQGFEDYWVVKLDAAGNQEWDRTFGGSDEDHLNALQQTSDGGYILGGLSLSDASGDKIQNSQGWADYWVLKLDAAGNKIWDKTFGSDDTDVLTALQQTTDGGYILGGGSASIGISGDKSQGTKGGFDYWVVKLHADGSKAWDKTFGGSGNDGFLSLEQTTDGGYILGGSSSSGISGDKSEALSGCDPNFDNLDFWVVKLDAAGTKQWDRNFGHCPTGLSGDDSFSGISQTQDGGYLIGGVYNSDLNGACTQLFCFQDFWVIKVDATGAQEWEKTIGGRFHDVPTDLQQTQDGGYILGGYSNSPASSDKTEDNIQVCELGEFETVTCFYDYWIVKLEPFQEAGQVQSFTLIDATSQQPIRALSEGDEINLVDLPTRQLNILANTQPAGVGSVKFQLSGMQNKNQLDNEAPYALFGGGNGEKNMWNPPPGSYTLTATAYSQPDGNGTAGSPLTVSFRMVNKRAGVAAGRLTQDQETGWPEMAPQLTLYPNPNPNGHLQVRLAGEAQGRLSYSLVSSIGRKLAEGTFNLTKSTNLLEFDFSHQIRAAGVYYLRLRGTNVHQVFKIMRR
jgi:hypothetical protein